MKKVSPFYNEAVQQIKSAILESQLESAKAVNRQMLSLFYESWQPVLNRSPTANDLENAENGPKSPKIPLFKTSRTSF